MAVLSNILAFLLGTPARIGLLITALTIFLTSNWRLSLSALLVQYVLVGMVLYGSIREVALVKILVGVLVVAILYLTARRIQPAHDGRWPDRGIDHTGVPHRWLRLHLGWLAGPLGFPLRLLSVVLILLAVVGLFSNYHLAVVPRDVAQVAAWLGGVGMMGLILSGDPLRVATAALTIMAGFDLLFSSLEKSLAIAAFFAAFHLLTALAFSYLVAVHHLAASHSEPEDIEP